MAGGAYNRREGSAARSVPRFHRISGVPDNERSRYYIWPQQWQPDDPRSRGFGVWCVTADTYQPRAPALDPKRSLGLPRSFGRCCTTPAIAPDWLGASGVKRAAIHSESGGYSMTSSARARIDGGTVNPSAFAVFRLTTNSNIVGCWTGRSAGLAF